MTLCLRIMQTTIQINIIVLSCIELLWLTIGIYMSYSIRACPKTESLYSSNMYVGMYW